MKHKQVWKGLILALMGSFLCFGQSLEDAGDVELGGVTARAKLRIGFSYDLLRDPTSVSFDYPEGRTAFNVPIAVPLPEVVGDIASNAIDTTTTGAIQPDFSAGQQLNLGFRVNVPMLGGVCGFSYTNNMDMVYTTILGNSPIGIDTALSESGTDISLTLKGGVYVPAELRMGWRTISFGYAFQPTKGMVMALNMHRHMFEFEGSANISVDLLGKLGIGSEQFSLDPEIRYSSDKLFGFAAGKYRADAWTPAFGVKLWRLGVTSRFGLDAKAQGRFDAKYAIPALVDPQTFEPRVSANTVQNVDSALAVMEMLTSAQVDSVSYHSTRDAEWRMPQGHTVSFDLVKNKLFVSYTKLIGDLELKHIYEGKDGDFDDTLDNRNDLDLGISVDNIILLGGRFKKSHFTMGVFTFDIRVFDNEKLIANALPKELEPWLILGGPALPVLSFGSSAGNTMQLLLQFDVLPLPSFKTGLTYFF